MPSGRVPIHTEDYKLNKIEKSRNFKLMLTAIEENSGHMIVLAEIWWGKSFCIKYDCEKPMHSRISMTKVSSHCVLNES